MSQVVLVVDDEPLVREIACALLEDLGCAVELAGSGSAALKKIARDENITLLMTDVQMPGMDGFELARRAVDVRPGLSVVIMSAQDYPRSGFRFVRKPFLETDLEKIVGIGCEHVKN
jgi:two-component system cell cycle response regulator CpdR